MQFIADHVAEHGWIGRKPIKDQFCVSDSKASLDLSTFQRMFPGAIAYDKSKRRYVMKQRKAKP